MTDENDSDEILTESSSVVMPRPTGRNSDVPLPIFHLSKAVVPGKITKCKVRGNASAAHQVRQGVP